MTTLVVGDVHGCGAELGVLLRAVRPTRVICVGDLYTKGPDPVGVWALLREHGAEAVLGNHDARLLAVLDGSRPDDTGGRRCVERLDAADRRWRAHLKGLPLTLEVMGWTVVHAGLHPTQGVAGTSRSRAISMRRFPGEADSDPAWTEVYRAPERVLYGHDARRGLVVTRRGSEPQTVGLDTGCVYGGQLTGLVLEEMRLVQVPARNVWASIR